jgi:site-specific DNA recombinase
MERLIDSFTEGLIEKDQFTSRMARTKTRITDLDAKIKAGRGDVDQMEHLRLATSRLRELAGAIGPVLVTADWHRRREIIRTLVQRIDIDTEVIKIIFRVVGTAPRRTGWAEMGGLRFQEPPCKRDSVTG